MFKNVLFSTFLFLLQLAVGAQQKALFNVSTAHSESGEASLAEIKQLILDNYYFDGITESDLDWAAIEGMLRHISPPEAPNLAQLWTDEEYEKILNSLKGIKVTMGFGSSFNSTDGSLTVTSLTKGSDAEARLALQDRILRIDNQALAGKSITEVNQLLDGELDQASTLTVVRDIAVFEVSLTRDSLQVENLVITEIPTRQAALIELKKVTLGMAKELDLALQLLTQKGITTIILDLRNNTGGVLNEGVNIARLFMKKSDIVLRTQSRSNGVSNYVADIDKFHNLILAVLINENTASSAEIIASALQDHQRAIIIGKKTYGKGVIETTYTLKNNYRVKFITSAMYSPLGKSWQTTGLLPDYFIDQSQANYQQVVNMSIAERLSNDLHLGTALKVLKR